MTGDDELLFEERQRLTQVWAWVLVGIMTILSAWAFVYQIVMGNPLGTSPAPDWAIHVIFWGFGLGLPIFLALLNLRTRVTRTELYVRWWPLWSRRIPTSQILTFEPVTYRPLLHYGGWGFRFSPRRGWAFNAKGNQGVRLSLRKGRDVLIGSQKHQALASALEIALEDTAAGGKANHPESGAFE